MHLSSPAPSVHPRALIYEPITTLDDLKKHLQWALIVELSTIPPYLCALYSVVDNTCEAYSLVRSVALEEMLHLMQVSNLMNAIGGKPSLTSPDNVPEYPGFMKHHAAGGPFIQLQPLSQALARTVFMAIELPQASPKVPAEGDYFHTIGQFYKAIEEGFENCVKKYGEKGVFGNDTGLQRTDFYLGAGGGELLKVTDLASAKEAICVITEQGEGAEAPQPPLPGEEPFGALDHYGPRLDGTYGPIIGTPWEMSHYRKFMQLADGEVPIPAVYPMIPNPRAEDFEGETRELADLFNACYSLCLQALEGAMTTPEVTMNFYGVAFPVMRAVLPALSTLLMQTPLNAGADPSLGPNAGPPFQYRFQPIGQILSDAERLHKTPPLRDKAYRNLWQDALSATREALAQSRQHALTARLPLL